MGLIPAEAIQPTRWAPATPPVEACTGHVFARIGAADVRAVSGGLVYWDAWPLLTSGGTVYLTSGGARWWFALAAPQFDDPIERHAHARIYSLIERDRGFAPLGPTLPDGLSPGSREWSGSATIAVDTGRVTLYFTAAGRRGERSVSVEQRLFGVTGTLGVGAIGNWSHPIELLIADEREYQRVDQPGEIGKIKAFRDPDLFHDPVSGIEWLLFTASSARRPGEYDGVIGAAVADGKGGFVTMRPLIDATGFNNELERPHLRWFDDRYYLFWSTQAHVFAPDAGAWPTGLYGAVANELPGPWRLLNGSGLVARNPPTAPDQAYSWLVLPDRTVTSFVDRWGAAGSGNFGGTFAPFAMLALNGAIASVR